MNQKYGKKVLAGLLGAVMACTALPAATAMQPAAEDTGDVLFSTGFEDGEFKSWCADQYACNCRIHGRNCEKRSGRSCQNTSF